MRFVSYMRRSAKILILNKEMIIEQISYERRTYESVDEKRVSKVMSRKKEFMHLRVKLTKSTLRYMTIELVTVRRKICKQIQFPPQNLRFLS